MNGRLKPGEGLGLLNGRDWVFASPALPGSSANFRT